MFKSIVFTGMVNNLFDLEYADRGCTHLDTWSGPTATEIQVLPTSYPQLFIGNDPNILGRNYFKIKPYTSGVGFLIRNKQLISNTFYSVWFREQCKLEFCRG